MSKTRRCLANFSFYDQRGIEKKLGQMAAQGWMIEQPGGLLWTYRKIRPQQLRFAVTYFPSASEFDPHPSQRQLMKEDFCTQDGWKLAARWDAMQIFYTDRADAVPIDTDPVTQVETIHRTMSKRILTAQLLSLALYLFVLVYQLRQLWRNPVDYLSTPSYLFSLPLWMLLVVFPLYELIYYFLWHRRAKKAAEQGIFLPVHTNRPLGWCLLAVAILLLILSQAGSVRKFLFLTVWAAVIVAMGLLGRCLSRWLKKRGVSRRVNQAATMGCILLLTVAGLAGLTAGILTGLLSFDDGHQPVGSYQWGSFTWDIYDDPMPLTVEDLVETDTQYSREADCQETFLLSRCEYEQRPLFNQEERDYQLSYTVTDIKLPFLYNFIRQSLLEERQDEAVDGYVFVDHYEPIDAAPWGAQTAYQVQREDGPRDTYLICWERRMVEIHFYWTPTPEQIRTAAELLGG